MKRTLPVLLFLGTMLATAGYGQELTLKRGNINEAIAVNDSIAETFSLFLPSTFDGQGGWPIVFIFDLKGRGKQSLHIFREAAENQGYILAASNSISDTVALSKNVLTANRMFNKVFELIPIQRNRIYTAGFGSGAKLASTIPTFIKEVEGVISCGSAVPNIELLNAKNPFHFVGIVGTQDFNYPFMRKASKELNKLKFPNHLLLFEGGHEWPPSRLLERSLEIFTISAMTKGNLTKNDQFIRETFDQRLAEMNTLLSSAAPLRAHNMIGEINQVYRLHFELDSLLEKRKTIRKSKLYKASKRSQNSAFFRESFIKDDYGYYLEEDLLTYNYNNLGWWNYQMGELGKYEKSNIKETRNMGLRLKSYLNALIEDEINLINAEKVKDEEGLVFLWMLKTITEPKEYQNYLNIISTSSRYEDFGTALFYLEELLKNGYTNKAELYTLEHTALLRISPDFNKIVNKYLKDARYEIIEE